MTGSNRITEKRGVRKTDPGQCSRIDCLRANLGAVARRKGDAQKGQFPKQPAEVSAEEEVRRRPEEVQGYGQGEGEGDGERAEQRPRVVADGETNTNTVLEAGSGFH